jgi:putative DNA primase/helicase
LTRELCRRVSREANKGAKSLASARTVNAVASLSRADGRIAAAVRQWDSNPWLLGTPGGTIDLKSGITLVNGVDDYITHITAVTQGGNCPLWLDTLNKITGQNRDLLDYFQRIAGYFLTGSVREEQMYFLYGGGGNGKGTFIETLAYVMGDYATTVAMSTLIQTKHSEHPTEIAKLRGIRLAVASETHDGARWNVARIKLLTGSDKLSGRFMRADFFEFDPSHKLVVSSNQRPILGRVDYATARRAAMVPFDVTFTVPDRTIKERLKAEAPGILAWMVEGCMLWQRWGIKPPAVVEKATAEYLHDMDDIQIFIDECCEQDPAARTPSTFLYEAWQTWCKRAGTYPGSKKDFTQRMMQKFKHTLVKNLTNFIGVDLSRASDYSSHDDYRTENDQQEMDPPF